MWKESRRFVSEDVGAPNAPAENLCEEEAGLSVCTGTGPVPGRTTPVPRDQLD